MKLSWFTSCLPRLTSQHSLQLKETPLSLLHSLTLIMRRSVMVSSGMTSFSESNGTYGLRNSWKGTGQLLRKQLLKQLSSNLNISSTIRQLNSSRSTCLRRRSLHLFSPLISKWLITSLLIWTKSLRWVFVTLWLSNSRLATSVLTSLLRLESTLLRVQMVTLSFTKASIKSVVLRALSCQAVKSKESLLLELWSRTQRSLFSMRLLQPSMNSHKKSFNRLLTELWKAVPLS